jgi:hypothetical protein
MHPSYDYAVFDEPPPAWRDPSTIKRNPSSKYYPIYARIDRMEVGKWLQIKGFTTQKEATRVQSSILANQDNLRRHKLGLTVKVVEIAKGTFSVLISKIWLEE